MDRSGPTRSWPPSIHQEHCTRPTEGILRGATDVEANCRTLLVQSEPIRQAAKGRVVRRDLLTMAHCLWCGATLRHGRGATYYCSDTHADLQAQWASRAMTTPTAPCPTLQKLATRYRGTALRSAVFRGLSPYRCQCGSFHLTSKPKSAKKYAKTLEQLAVELHLTAQPTQSV